MTVNNLEISPAPERDVNRGGRPKGSVNWRTRQIQAFCRSVCEDPLYRKSVLDRARAGTLGPMEPVILAYAYGKPKETVELHVGPIEEDLSELSIQELAQRAEDITRQLKEAAEIQAALPAEFRSVLSVESFDHAESPAEPSPHSTEGAENTAEVSSLASVDAQNPTETSVDVQEPSNPAGFSARTEER